MKKVCLIILILTSFSAVCQEINHHAENLLKDTLHRSIEYNCLVIHLLKQIQKKENADKEDNIPAVLLEKKHEALQSAEELVTYLKQHNLTSEKLANYRSIMSQYRLKTAVQLIKIIKERKRLKEDWYSNLNEKARRTIENSGYIRHDYRIAELKHQDTEQRISEYLKKSDDIAHGILTVLQEICSSESAKKYEYDLPGMFRELDESISILNIYLYEDDALDKKAGDEIYKQFYNLNIRMSRELNRIQRSDSYGLSALRDFIQSQRQPILWLLK